MPDEVVARFEFRAFAQSFGDVDESMRRLAGDESIEESREVAIVRRGVIDRNVKIRERRLEVKHLLQMRDGLEQWEPLAKLAFPVSQADLHSNVFPDSDIAFRQRKYDAESLLAEIVNPVHGLYRVNLFKRRRRFHIDGCAAEIDEVLVNGAAIRSVAIEADDAELVSATRRRARLGEYENVSYPLQLSRIIGLSPCPDENRYA